MAAAAPRREVNPVVVRENYVTALKRAGRDNVFTNVDALFHREKPVLLAQMTHVVKQLIDENRGALLAHEFSRSEIQEGVREVVVGEIRVPLFYYAADRDKKLAFYGLLKTARLDVKHQDENVAEVLVRHGFAKRFARFFDELQRRSPDQVATVLNAGRVVSAVLRRTDVRFFDTVIRVPGVQLTEQQIVDLIDNPIAAFFFSYVDYLKAQDKKFTVTKPMIERALDHPRILRQLIMKFSMDNFLMTFGDEQQGLLHLLAINGGDETATNCQMYIDRLKGLYPEHLLDVLNRGNKRGECAIHLAAFHKRTEMVRQLTTAGCSLTLKTTGAHPHTPLDRANERFFNADVREILETVGNYVTQQAPLAQGQGSIHEQRDRQAAENATLRTGQDRLTEERDQLIAAKAESVRRGDRLEGELRAGNAERDRLIAANAKALQELSERFTTELADAKREISTLQRRLTSATRTIKVVQEDAFAVERDSQQVPAHDDEGSSSGDEIQDKDLEGVEAR